METFFAIVFEKERPPRQTCLPGALLILLSPKEIAKKFTIRFSCSRIRLVIVKIISILLYSYRLNRTFYKHESGCLAGKGKDEQCRIKELTGREVYVREFENIKKSDRVNSAGRASYVERNQWMVDESNIVIIQFDATVNRTSGTKRIYDYAIHMKGLIKKKDLTMQ